MRVRLIRLVERAAPGSKARPLRLAHVAEEVLIGGKILRHRLAHPIRVVARRVVALRLVSPLGRVSSFTGNAGTGGRLAGGALVRPFVIGRFEHEALHVAHRRG